ncbi:N-acetylmuramoyl-L-alanine amidase family protein [Brevifollis gellanilyticus]|uniref:N-acetylmuramoyl-L-alanine amidase n=1 Tax=Brevifollis gellanilyticus TaxID=748831 RepID=A0A512M7V1_9BACT|nr:N-acetylmuramoyl-L-alanine amidase [Brevifollis gellanilyticus]GEP42809.1 hypothetical protein BGE01nite_21000 [Brevifollis gellanilyticus]
MSPHRPFQLFLRCFGSSLALAVAFGALGWLALQIEALPEVSLPSWDADAAPLVVVDAGHGGHDGGAVANGVTEKDLSLNLARQLKAHLEKAGVRVRMTREKDRFLELDERCQIAAEAKADAFVSVHLNTNPASEIHGIETYYASSNSLMARPMKAQAVSKRRPTGEALAQTIQRQVCTSTKAEDRGIKDSQLIVVMRTPCPAALVECGFLTHAEESKRLQQKAYQAKLTRGISDGLVEFLKSNVQLPGKSPARVVAQ